MPQRCHGAEAGALPALRGHHLRGGAQRTGGTGAPLGAVGRRWLGDTTEGTGEGLGAPAMYGDVWRFDVSGNGLVSGYSNSWVILWRVTNLEELWLAASLSLIIG